MVPSGKTLNKAVWQDVKQVSQQISTAVRQHATNMHRFNKVDL